MGEDPAAIRGKKNWVAADAIPEPIALLDKAGRITAVNKAWRRASPGKEPSIPAALGVLYLDLCRSGAPGLPLPRAEAISAGLNAVIEGRTDRFSCDYVAPNASGVEHRFVVNIAPLPKGRGGMVSHFDLGPRKSESVYRSRVLSETILDETEDAFFLCDPKGRVLMANAATAKWLGVDAADIVGKKGSEIVSQDLGRFLLEQNAETIAHGKTHTFETNLATAQGFRTLLVTKGVHRSANGKVKGVFGIARDISELKAMEREIIDTSDKEKQRLGQELHENLCQYLVGISLLGNVLFEDLLRLKLKQAEDARQITTLVKDAIAEVRALAKGLAPMHQEQEEGLIVALQELAEQARVIGKIRCSLRVPRTASFVDETTSIHLFRIAQEAVHNAIKHSQAKRLQIVLSNSRKEVTLTVQDDGVGFNQGDPPKGENSSGLGLHIMKYRSRAIGAELEIRRLPEGGTAIVCTMPK